MSSLSLNLLTEGPPDEKSFPESEKEYLENANQISESTCKKNGCFVVLFVLIGSAGILAVYLVAVKRGHVKPFLPFISEAGGSPPQNGVFSILMFLLAAIGIIVMTFRYYNVINLNTKDDWKVRWSNRIGYFTGILSGIGLIITGAYPVNMNHYKEVWVDTTLIPHLIGASTVYIGGTSYIFWQTVITMFFMKQYMVLFIIRALLFILCIATFAPCNLTFVDVVKEMRPIVFSQQGNSTSNGTAIMEQEMSYSTNYIICSASEWVLTVSLLLYMATLFRDAQNISLRISFNLLSTRENVATTNHVDTA